MYRIYVCIKYVINSLSNEPQVVLHFTDANAQGTSCTANSKTSFLIGPDNVIRSNLPDIDLPTNVPFHQFMFDRCDQYKSLVAVEDFLTGQKYTYSQMKEKAIKIASGLHRLGYRKGDVICVYSANHINFSVLMLACAATGVWFSAVNPAFTADELCSQLVHSGSKAVFTSPQGVLNVTRALKLKENQVKGLFVFGEAEGFRPFQTLLDDDGRMLPDVDINPVTDVFVLPYSSGTAGLPKGVMLTHFNCMANCKQIFCNIPTSPSDRALGLLPLYHIYGMIVIQFAVLLGGASVTFLPKFQPETFLQCIQDKQITLAHLVPPIVLFISKHPMVSEYNLTSLERILCGAAPMGVEISREFLKRLDHGVILNQGADPAQILTVFQSRF
ncbi:4-coumarate--CoA ligase 3 [Bulinus truncatus]|nr:4-coumarate--CoA ligase 3 [Bulinus truncatus]